ncbi:hypothetical protein ABT299_17645 [Spirillospora sp. NPDC000708]
MRDARVWSRRSCAERVLQGAVALDEGVLDLLAGVAGVLLGLDAGGVLRARFGAGLVRVLGGAGAFGGDLLQAKPLLPQFGGQRRGLLAGGLLGGLRGGQVAAQALDLVQRRLERPAQLGDLLALPGLVGAGGGQRRGRLLGGPGELLVAAAGLVASGDRLAEPAAQVRGQRLGLVGAAALRVGGGEGLSGPGPRVLGRPVRLGLDRRRLRADLRHARFDARDGELAVQRAGEQGGRRLKPFDEVPRAGDVTAEAGRGEAAFALLGGRGLAPRRAGAGRAEPARRPPRRLRDGPPAEPAGTRGRCALDDGLQGRGSRRERGMATTVAACRLGPRQRWLNIPLRPALKGRPVPRHQYS